LKASDAVTGWFVRALDLYHVLLQSIGNSLAVREQVNEGWIYDGSIKRMLKQPEKYVDMSVAGMISLSVTTMNSDPSHWWCLPAGSGPINASQVIWNMCVT
jgi:hypothetical protein